MASQEGMQPLDLEETVWCEGCRKLKKEVNRLQEEHTINYQTLKQKIISTDLLIRKYRTKCEEYDVQSKRLEEQSRRLDRSQLDCEMLETQLKASLQSTEPLKQARLELEAKLKVKDTEINNLRNSLEGAEMMRKQYEALITANDVLSKEEDRKQIEKKMQSLESSNSRYVNQLKSNKDELRSVKSDIARSSKRYKLLETRLGRAVTKLEKYWCILKENELLPRGDKKPCRVRIMEDSTGETSQEEDEDEESDPYVEEVNNNASPVGNTDNNHDDDNDDIDDEDFDEVAVPSMEFSFTFSPLCAPVSPLPPSPAPRKTVKSSSERTLDDNEDSMDIMATNLQSQLMEDSSDSIPKSVRRSPRLKGKTDNSLFSSGDEQNGPSTKDTQQIKQTKQTLKMRNKTKSTRGSDKVSIKPSPKLQSKLDFMEKEDSGFDFDDVVPEISDSEDDNVKSDEGLPVMARKGSAPFVVQHLIKDVMGKADVEDLEPMAEEDTADGADIDMSEPHLLKVTPGSSSDFQQSSSHVEFKSSHTNFKKFTEDEKDVTKTADNEPSASLPETNERYPVLSQESSGRITRSMSQSVEKISDSTFNITMSRRPKSAMEKIQFLTPPPPRAKRLRALSPRKTDNISDESCKQSSRKRTVSLPSDLSVIDNLAVRKSPRSKDKEEVPSSPLSKKSRSQSEENLKKTTRNMDSDSQSPVRVLRSRSKESSPAPSPKAVGDKVKKISVRSVADLVHINSVSVGTGISEISDMVCDSSENNPKTKQNDVKIADSGTSEVADISTEKQDSDEAGGQAEILKSKSIKVKEHNTIKGTPLDVEHQDRQMDVESNMKASADIKAGDISEQESSESDIFEEKQKRTSKPGATALIDQKSVTKQSSNIVIISDSDTDTCKNSIRKVVTKYIPKKINVLSKSPKKFCLSSDSESSLEVEKLSKKRSPKKDSPRKSVIESSSESEHQEENLKSNDSDVSLHLSTSDTDADVKLLKPAADNNSKKAVKERRKQLLTSDMSSSDSDREVECTNIQKTVSRQSLPEKPNRKKRGSGRRVSVRVNQNTPRFTSKEFISTESDSDEESGDKLRNKMEQNKEMSSNAEVVQNLEIDPVHSRQTEGGSEELASGDAGGGAPEAPGGRRQRGTHRKGVGRRGNGNQAVKKYPLRATTYPKLSDSFIKLAILLPGSNTEKSESETSEMLPDDEGQSRNVTSVLIEENKTTSDEGRTGNKPSPPVSKRFVRPSRQRHVPLETDKEFVDIILERRRITRSVSDGSSSEARKSEGENKAMKGQVSNRIGSFSKRTEMFVEKIKNSSEKLKTGKVFQKGKIDRLKGSAKLEDSGQSSDDVRDKGQVTQSCPSGPAASEIEGFVSVEKSDSTANSITDSDMHMSDMDTINVVVYQDEIQSSASESVIGSPVRCTKSLVVNLEKCQSKPYICEVSGNVRSKEEDVVGGKKKEKDQILVETVELTQDIVSDTEKGSPKPKNTNSMNVKMASLLSDPNSSDGKCLKSNETDSVCNSVTGPATSKTIRMSAVTDSDKLTKYSELKSQKNTCTTAESDVSTNNSVGQGPKTGEIETSENGDLIHSADGHKQVTTSDKESEDKSSEAAKSLASHTKSVTEDLVAGTAAQNTGKDVETKQSSVSNEGTKIPQVKTPSKSTKSKRFESETSQDSDAEVKPLPRVKNGDSFGEPESDTQDDFSDTTSDIGSREDNLVGKKVERKQVKSSVSEPEALDDITEEHIDGSKEKSDGASDLEESSSVQDSAEEAGDAVNEENMHQSTSVKSQRRVVMKRQKSFDHEEGNSLADKAGTSSSEKKIRCELLKKRKNFVSKKNKCNVDEGNEMRTRDDGTESQKSGQKERGKKSKTKDERENIDKESKELPEVTGSNTNDLSEKYKRRAYDDKGGDVDEESEALEEVPEIEGMEQETDEDSDDAGKRKRVETQHSFGFSVGSSETTASAEGSGLLDSLNLIPELVECEEEFENFAEDGVDSKSILSELGSLEPDRFASPEIVSLTQKSSFMSISALIRDEFSMKPSTSSPLPPSPMNFLRIHAPVSPLPSSPSLSRGSPISPDGTLTPELSRRPRKGKKKPSKKSKKRVELEETVEDTDITKLAPLDETISCISGPVKRIARVARPQSDLPKFGANLSTTTGTVKPKAVYSRLNSGGDNPQPFPGSTAPAMSLAKQQLGKRQQNQQEKEKKSRKRKSSESEAIPQKKQVLPPQKASAESSTALEKELSIFLDSPDSLAESFIQTWVDKLEVNLVAMEIFRAAVKVLQMSKSDQLPLVVGACNRDSRDTEETFMTDTETRLLNLITTIVENYEECPRHQLMELLWNAIFLSCTSVTGRMALCRMFTAMCRYEGDVEQVRVFIFKLLTCGYLQYIEPIIAVVCVWPLTLMATADVSPMIQVIRHIILSTCLAETATENIKKLAPCFQAMCEWSPLTETPVQLLSTVIEKLKLHIAAEDCHVFEAMKSIELLLWIHGWKFIYTNFVNRHLGSMADAWKAKGDNSNVNPKYAMCLIRIFGNIYNLPRFTQKHKEFSKGLKRCLISTLEKPTEHKELQMCCAEVLAELSPFHPHFIMDVLSQWYKKNRSAVTSNTRLKLEDTRKFLSSKITTFGVDAFI